MNHKNKNTNQLTEKYIMVSKHKENALTLEEQRKAAKCYAEKCGFESMQTEPEISIMQRMLNDAQKGKFDNIIFKKKKS